MNAMAMAMAMAVGLWLAAGAAPAKEAKAPREVWDFYELLARGKKLDGVLQRQGSAWRYAKKVEDEEVEGVGTPVVDGRNGYMAYEYSLRADHEKIELALFTAADGRNFLAVHSAARTERSEFSSFALYEFTGEAFRDVTQSIGLPASLGLKDFMDEKWVPTPTKAKGDGYVFKAEDAVLVNVHLPRQGTTVTVDLGMAQNPPPTDDGPKQLADFQKLIQAHRKVKAFELAWSKADAKFTVAKKR